MYKSSSTIVMAILMVAFTSGQNSTAKVTTTCSNPPPGVAKMVRGVDITTLDMTPLQITSSSGYKYPVLEFTCNDKRVWNNPQNKEYQLPDQVWHMTTVPGGWMSANVDMYKSGMDVRRSMSQKVGAEGKFLKFSFSGSHSFNKLQHTIHNMSKFVEEVAAFESATRVDFIPDWILTMDRYAQMYLDRRVSGTFESNRQSYNGFIKEFGTHYFASGNFGGYIRSTFETSQSYVYTRSESETKANAKASFFKMISLHGGTVSGSTTVSELFRKSTVIDTGYFGGDTNLLKSDGMSTWQYTVDEDPWLFSGQLKPIYQLITDNTKRESMEKAVSEYLMRSFLEEISRTLTALKMKLNDDPVLNALQSRLDKMKSLSTLKEADVEALGNDVTAQTVIPRWFSDRTKLCYKWRPDGDGGQCGGGAGRVLCAGPNSMTPVYRDDTDRRGGGCRMQWAITSSGFPSWFNNVQVCFRWYPDGDGGQCGGGAPRLICSSINSYTREYRDDTDRRGGGCKMSWRIVVPSSAPAWIKTAKLCYNWYPDGDGGQCSASSRSLCAVANAWTEYYRDDTDRRSGGCRMSWGLKVGL